MIRLVLQTDGTGQDGNDAITNVSRLSDFLADGEDDQHCSYSPGVGTCIGEELDGKVAGAHLEKVMNHQYSWLSRSAGSLKLTDKDDFEVELFGFSRGAFISRLLADLLNRCGVPKIPSDAAALVKLYKEKDWEKMDAMTKARPKTSLRLASDFLAVGTRLSRRLVMMELTTRPCQTMSLRRHMLLQSMSHVRNSITRR